MSETIANLDKLREDMKEFMMNGWERENRTSEVWNRYLAEEVEPYCPTLYKFLKGVEK